MDGSKMSVVIIGINFEAQNEYKIVNFQHRRNLWETLLKIVITGCLPQIDSFKAQIFSQSPDIGNDDFKAMKFRFYEQLLTCKELGHYRLDIQERCLDRLTVKI